MHRIDSYGATADNRFTDGDPVVPTPPTVVKDDWLNAVQEEIAHVIETAGLTLDKSDNRQLALAISAYFTARRINTAAPLTGGGDLSADRTLGLAGFAVLAGMPIMVCGGKLERNCAWPDGSLVLFEDWPDLQARYVAGHITALAAGTPAATIANYPGRFVAHAAGLYLPSLGGLFPRPWTPAQTQDAGRGIGSLQTDAIRNIVGGWLPTQTPAPCRWNLTSGSGAILPYDAVSESPLFQARTDGSKGQSAGFTFDASRAVPTATENRPTNYAQPVQIYLGRHKSEV